MLTLTRKADYALIALAHLANVGEGCVSAREIANHYGIPLPLLMNILKLLTQQGLAKSVRGPRGGYTLATPPWKVTLLDVIRAVEGPIQLVQCVDLRDDGNPAGDACTCELMSVCPVRSPVHRIQDRLVKFLSEVTLADIADDKMGSPPVESAATTGD